MQNNHPFSPEIAGEKTVEEGGGECRMMEETGRHPGTKKADPKVGLGSGRRNAPKDQVVNVAAAAVVTAR